MEKLHFCFNSSWRVADNLENYDNNFQSASIQTIIGRQMYLENKM